MVSAYFGTHQGSGDCSARFALEQHVFPSLDRTAVVEVGTDTSLIRKVAIYKHAASAALGL